MIGRFTTVDRFAEKYKSHTPYHYTLNNPIKSIDINGDSIKTTGSQSATASMKQVAETGMGGSVTMSQNSNGVWDMTKPSTYDLEGMTAEQTAMYNNMNDNISGPGMASFNLVDEHDPISNQVEIGDNGASPNSATPGVHTIDMDDIKNIGSTGVLTAQGALTHEMTEGVAMQTKGASAASAHFDTAIPNESAVNGVTINLNRRSAPTGTSNGNTQTIQIPVTVNGVQRMVTMTFVNGNLPPGGMQNNTR